MKPLILHGSPRKVSAASQEGLDPSEQEESFCEDYEIKKKDIRFWTYVALVGVVCVNQIVKRTLEYIVVFEKPHTSAMYNSSMAVKVFTAQV